MRVSEAVEQLLLATEAAGYSDHTVKFYRSKLKPLVAFLAEKPVEDVTTDDLRSFVASQRRRNTRWDNHPNKRQKRGGLSEATIAGNVRAAKRLFRFLEEEGVIDANPAARLKQIKLRRGEPKAASLEDLPKLLDLLAGQDKLSKRNRALLLVLIDTACRVGGLSRLRVQDVDVDAGRVYLHEKGNKGRYAFITPCTRDAVLDWLEVRPEDGGDYLWVTLGSQGRGQLTTQGVRELLRRLKKRAAIQGPINPHAWRHAFAREYLLNGGDLASLADIMGHADVMVTHHSYAIFLQDELKAKHALHSPLARLHRDNVVGAEEEGELPSDVLPPVLTNGTSADQTTSAGDRPD